MTAAVQSFLRFPFFISVVFAAVALSGCASLKGPDIQQPPAKMVFDEVWGYLIRGHEDQLTGGEPFTDICYFSAELNDEGRIQETIARPSLTLGIGAQPRTPSLSPSFPIPPSCTFP